MEVIDRLIFLQGHPPVGRGADQNSQQSDISKAHM